MIDLPHRVNEPEWSTLLASSGNPWQSSWLAKSTVDLHHDGDRALIFASRTKPALVAVSAKTGEVVWLFRGRTKVPGIDANNLELIPQPNSELAARHRPPGRRRRSGFPA